MILELLKILKKNTEEEINSLSIGPGDVAEFDIVAVLGSTGGEEYPGLFLWAVPGDLKEFSEFSLDGNGAELISGGIVQGRFESGEWQNICGFENKVAHSGTSPISVSLEIRLNPAITPATIGKVLIGLAIGITDKYIPPFPPPLPPNPDTDEAAFVFDTPTKTIEGYNTGYGPDIGIPATIGGVAVEEIGLLAFFTAGDVETVSFPAGLINIGDYAFFGRDVLIVGAIPATLENVGLAAFFGSRNSGAPGLEFPASVVSIGAQAFSGYGAAFYRILNAACAIGEDAFYTSAVIQPIIYGYAGSTAETYATDNSLEFVTI